MPRTKCASHSLFSPSRRLNTALIWTRAICSGETFFSLSEMLGTSLFWPLTMPASYQPVWTSVIVRSFSTSRERHPAIRNATTRHAVNRMLMPELYIALDRTPVAAAGSVGRSFGASVGRPSGPALSVISRLDLLADFFDCHTPGAIRREVAAFDAEDHCACIRGVGRDERIAWHIVTRGDGEPLLGAKRDGAAVLNHRVHERRFHLTRVVFLRVVVRRRIRLRLSAAANRHGRGPAAPSGAAQRRRDLCLLLQLTNDRCQPFALT